jgi:hypothetical protein
MAIDVAAIMKRRQKDRDAVKSGEPGPMIRLELQYIADSLEAMREEFALANVTERARKAAK